jgi:tetratricopeptide (TPR) repeat protein
VKAAKEALLSAVPEDVPPELRKGYAVLRQEGERNEVLNCLELGLDAMQLEHWESAAKFFDIALNRIEAIYGDNPAAMRARSLWHAEGEKTFKGEPYERVMAYYYRGILFLKAGDLQNARACFKAGQFQDSFAEEAQHRSDFASLTFLEAWCSFMLNQEGDAVEAINELKRLRSDCPLPEAGQNVLIVAESGTAPRKLNDGVHWEKLVYRRGKNIQDKKVAVQLEPGGPKVVLYPAEDVYLQAATRGGRPVDYILKGKLKFKNNFEMAGTVLSDAGVVGFVACSVLDSGAGTPLFFGLEGVTILSDLIAIRINPRADTRCWRNLPDAIHVSTLQLSSGAHRARVIFLDESGNLINEKNLELVIPLSGKNYAVLWTKSSRQFWSGQSRKYSLF